MKCPHESRQVGLTSIVLFSIKILFKKNHSIAELAARHNYDGIFNGKIGLLLSDPRDDFFEGGGAHFIALEEGGRRCQSLLKVIVENVDQRDR